MGLSTLLDKNMEKSAYCIEYMQLLLLHDSAATSTFATTATRHRASKNSGIIGKPAGDVTRRRGVSAYAVRRQY
jgi:hypothetical protein